VYDFILEYGGSVRRFLTEVLTGGSSTEVLDEGSRRRFTEVLNALSQRTTVRTTSRSVVENYRGTTL